MTNNRTLSKAQILFILLSHELLSKLNVTHQFTYFLYLLYQIQFKFERMSRIKQLLQKLSSEQDSLI